MIKAKALKRGDKLAIVSLSSGMLGEDFCKHYIELGQKRIRSFGLEPVFMPNALKGIEFIENNPEKRAEDLKAAFYDDEIKGIICAIGGLDSYKTYEFLLEDDKFIQAVKNNPKIFSGFSDTTHNHLMFYKLGLTTYYGPSYINDFSEADTKMLDYTKKYIKNYYMGENVFAKITPSDIWYEERTDFSANSIGTSRISHKENKGFELIQGKDGFKGKLLGGCLDSLAMMITGERDIKQKEICEKYNIIPDKEEWKNKILFIETSENKPDEETYRRYLKALKSKGIFENINGIIHGKPQDEAYYEEYKKILIEEAENPDLPILYNVNFGHAFPRTILAYGIEVFACEKGIEYLEECVKK